MGNLITLSKTTRNLFLIALGLGIGFFAARWSSAQSGNRVVEKSSPANFSLALDQMNLLISYLQANKDTNALTLFNNFETASIAIQESGEMGVTLHTLMAIREGRTNDAIQLMQIQLSGEIVAVASMYRDTPESQRQSFSLSALDQAKWYYNKFSFKPDAGIAHAFEVLDGKAAK
jgi:hypothetical protein